MSISILSSGKSWVQRTLSTLPPSMPQWFRRGGYFLLGAVGAVIFIPLAAFLFMEAYFYGRAFPGVAVAGVAVGDLPGNVIEQRVQSAGEEYVAQEWPTVFTYKQEEMTVSFAEVGGRINATASTKAALEVGREGPLWEQAKERFLVLREGVQLPFVVDWQEDALASVSGRLAAAVNEPAVPATVELLDYPDQVTNSRIRVNRGATGKQLDETAFQDGVKQAVARGESVENSLPIATVGKEATEAQVVRARERAEALIGKELSLEFQESGQMRDWTLNEADLIGFLRIEGGYAREPIEGYVQGMAESINRPAQDAKFVFNAEQSRVEEFKAALPGLSVDVEETAERLIRALQTLEKAEAADPVVVLVSKTAPEVTLESVNDLGIKDLLGRGVSTYYGSIASRVHNVALAAERINGTLVKPGEVFSFNQAVGEISANTGYQSAYVIRNGRTELGDGGGVCQDSTTVFRAALDAGLPIEARRSHSYRVGYYEQNAKPGLDATVFSPTTDLQFKNDTAAYILIQAKADTPNRTLTVEIYGTDDGRESIVTEPVVWDVTPPPPDVYQDDPTLPEGVVKQVDWKAWGAKSKFDYTVTRNGETLIEKTFYSNYKPWAAVFLKGTGPAQP